MPASDLFTSSSDAHFRLYGTYIVVGRTVCQVIDVLRGDDRDSPEAAILALRIPSSLSNMANMGDRVINVPLGQLPLRSMYECPSGYYGESWVSRGPARQRYQGLTTSSFWFRDMYGGIEPNGMYSVTNILRPLITQKAKRSAKTSIRVGKPLTNRIMITREKFVLSCGEAIGEYAGNGNVKLLPGVQGKRVRHDLDAAGVKIIL